MTWVFILHPVSVDRKPETGMYTHPHASLLCLKVAREWRIVVNWRLSAPTVLEAVTGGVSLIHISTLGCAINFY